MTENYSSRNAFCVFSEILLVATALHASRQYYSPRQPYMRLGASSRRDSLTLFSTVLSRTTLQRIHCLDQRRIDNQGHEDIACV